MGRCCGLMRVKTEKKVGKIISDQIHFTPHGFDIIGIASKEYASWVESKGYNVITNQGEWFFVNLGEVFSKLGYKENRFT